jgi:ABC-type antimicrobial peptide transport system permease subunit
LLAGIGLYSVLAQSTTQRTREFGVRLALGAERRDLLILVARQGILLTAIGMTGGLTAAFVLTRFLKSLLYGVNAGDPLMFAAVSMVLLAIALLAIVIPALRASRTDPAVVLRYE